MSFFSTLLYRLQYSDLQSSNPTLDGRHIYLTSRRVSGCNGRQPRIVPSVLDAKIPDHTNYPQMIYLHWSGKIWLTLGEPACRAGKRLADINNSKSEPKFRASESNFVVVTSMLSMGDKSSSPTTRAISLIPYQKKNLQHRLSLYSILLHVFRLLLAQHAVVQYLQYTNWGHRPSFGR